MSGLLPCPFCGNAPEISREKTSVGSFWSIICTNDDCLTPCVSIPKKADCIARWNRRSFRPMASGDGVAVAWRVKDFADGWILCHTEERARREAEGAWNLVQALGVIPPT